MRTIIVHETCIKVIMLLVFSFSLPLFQLHVKCNLAVKVNIDQSCIYILQRNTLGSCIQVLLPVGLVIESHWSCSVIYTCVIVDWIHWSLVDVIVYHTVPMKSLLCLVMTVLFQPNFVVVSVSCVPSLKSIKYYVRILCTNHISI